MLRRLQVHDEQCAINAPESTAEGADDADGALLRAMLKVPCPEGVTMSAYFKDHLKDPIMPPNVASSYGALMGRWGKLVRLHAQAKRNKKPPPGWDTQRMEAMQWLRFENQGNAAARSTAMRAPLASLMRPNVVNKAGEAYIEVWDKLMPKLRVEARAHFLPKGKSWVPGGEAFLRRSVQFWQSLLELVEEKQQRRAIAGSRS